MARVTVSDSTQLKLVSCSTAAAILGHLVRHHELPPCHAVPAANPKAVPAANPEAVPAAYPAAVPAAYPDTVPAVYPDAVPVADPDAVPAAYPDATRFSEKIWHATPSACFHVVLPCVVLASLTFSDIMLARLAKLFWPSLLLLT